MLVIQYVLPKSLPVNMLNMLHSPSTTSNMQPTTTNIPFSTQINNDPKAILNTQTQKVQSRLYASSYIQRIYLLPTYALLVFRTSPLTRNGTTHVSMLLYAMH